MLNLLVADGIEVVCDMRLHVAQPDEAWWSNFQDQSGIDKGDYVVLAPTSRWPSKRWPGEHWSALIEPLLSHGVKHLVLIGSPSERSQVRWLALNPACLDRSVIDLVGSTTVGQTMAIVQGAKLVIANDSAPLHMAVGFDRPCVALFGPTAPARVGPYERLESVLRHPALAPQTALNFKDPKLGDALMRAIRPADVLHRVEALLALTERSPQVAQVTADVGRAQKVAL